MPVYLYDVSIDFSLAGWNCSGTCSCTKEGNSWMNVNAIYTEYDIEHEVVRPSRAVFVGFK